jgi:hypothetical protein
MLSAIVHAQDLESIGKEKPVKVNGGLSLNQILYAANGIESRREPYSLYASGSVNVSIYGWSIPLSFGISNQNSEFNQPFNQYSVHPTFKSVTAHVGYTSVAYSPYTLNGHVFLGAAVDVAPEGRWKFNGMFGRLFKAVESDTSHVVNLPSFKRLGCGLNASYNTGKDFVDVILFHAEDDITSIKDLPDSLNILPHENLVISLAAGKSILNNFLLKAEIASSAMSADTRAPESNSSHPLATAKFLFAPRLSSSFYKAFKASFDYQQDFFTVGLGFEHIDPQYRTLGAYYFNNDLQNLTINVATSLFAGKMNVAASGGSQRDNLDGSKMSTLQRAVGSLSINYTPSERLNISGSFSNFRTFTNVKPEFQQVNQLTPYDLDTLNFTQLSQNATVSMMYRFGRNENRKQNVNFNCSVQDASDTQGDTQSNPGTRFYNFNAAYAINMVPARMTVSLSFNATINYGQGVSSKTYGPVASVNRSFLENKLRAALSLSYNDSFSNGNHVNKIINARFTFTYSMKKKHNVSLSTVVMNRETKKEGGGRSVTEFTAMVGYGYSFSR